MNASWHMPTRPWRSAALRTGGVLTALAAVACSAVDVGASRGAREPAAPSASCTQGATQACTCASGAPGNRACGAAGFGVCTCSVPAAAGNAGAAAPVSAMPPISVPPSAGDDSAPALMPADDNRSTGVSFDWPETDPSTAGSCKPGHYVGQYSCRLYIIQTSGPGAIDISGTVDMQLEETADGELLKIANGTFSSDTLAAIPVHADIVGQLDCSASKFDGMLENGTFSVALDLPVPFTQGTFEGPLSADYDKSAAQLANGAWNMTGELDLFPGSCMDGTWSAQWTAN